MLKAPFETNKRKHAKLLDGPRDKRVVAEFTFVEVDEKLHAARRQHSLKSMGQLSAMHPERRHEGSQSTATRWSRQNHIARVAPEIGMKATAPEPDAARVISRTDESLYAVSVRFRLSCLR